MLIIITVNFGVQRFWGCTDLVVSGYGYPATFHYLVLPLDSQKPDNETGLFINFTYLLFC